MKLLLYFRTSEIKPYKKGMIYGEYCMKLGTHGTIGYIYGILQKVFEGSLTVEEAIEMIRKIIA